MAQPLPRLRMNLDFMPSPVEDRPGLLIRDSYGYSDAILIIPPELVQCLSCFDGEQSSLDLRELLVRMTGELDVGSLEGHLLNTLSSAGFLHDETYERMREQKRLEFSAAESRVASHAGSAYPDDPVAVRQTLNQYLDGIEPPPKPANLLGIAAPHVSPFGGWQTYRSAYTALSDEHRDRTFVILGTSHYGDPERFGLTRKPFDTPYGRAITDIRLVDELGAQPAATMEDYCHSMEHSIEFQVLFLQHLYGPQIRILPILCGSFGSSILSGGTPEDNEAVRRFLGSLGEIAAREGDKLTWVLGIDMAHMGARYGDDLVAIAGQNEMQDVALRDKQRIDRVLASDAQGFWNLVQENQDDLKWCGSSPLYTFLRAVPGAKGSLRAYDQWNIDERSVVSFAALTFAR
ncbi:MAG TPA: AmmeMemoRadiSam system protein B [Bryobacteraceae bacterium]|nr:AmmeMemoRadiSam system protein B [Bryobacteraceae bacterium]